MKKSIINPVVNQIRSANYQSPRYSMNRSKGTYADSIENMAGSGYNKDSKKLRTLYDDAKGIAIGARPNPETNAKRFWGLYGQQANTKPYQAMQEMSNDMRQKIDELRYGNTNRRITKRAKIEKESYYNTFGGGYDPNVVVTPKKGRPYKGQPDSLPLVTKRANKISKAGENTFPENYKNFMQTYQNLNSDYNKPVAKWNPTLQNEDYRRLQTQYALGNPWMDERGDVQPPLLRSWNDPQITSGGTFKKPKKRSWTDQEFNNYLDTAARNYGRNTPSSTYTALPKYQSDDWRIPFSNKVITERQREQAGDLATNPAMMIQQWYPRAALQSSKILGRYGPKGIKKPAQFFNPKKLGGKALANFQGFTDWGSAASSMAHAGNAINQEMQYQYPTTMATSRTKTKQVYPSTGIPSLPLITSVKEGDAANRKFGDAKTFLDIVSGFMNPEGEKIWPSTIPNPLDPEYKQIRITNPADLLNRFDQSNATGDYSESVGRKKLPAKFSDLPLAQQQEYGRFGKPVETRIKPNLMRMITEGLISSLTGQSFVGQSYNKENKNPWEYLDNLFFDQMSHKGMAQGPLTEVYGYSPEGNLKAARVSRPLQPAMNPGQNMAPLYQFPEGNKQSYKLWYDNPLEFESLASKYQREKYGRVPGLSFQPRELTAEQAAPSQYIQPYFPEFMMGSQLSYNPQDPRANFAPTYIPESQEDVRNQALMNAANAVWQAANPRTKTGKGIMPWTSTNDMLSSAARSLFGKSMKPVKISAVKKSITPTLNAGTKHVIGGFNGKSLSKSMTTSKKPVSASSSRHSNKYMK
jgi:hypothetical protein